MILSRMSFVSASDLPSGATSRSWKQKNGTPSLLNSSNAAAAFSFASSTASAPSRCQGRPNVPAPNTSKPFHTNVCQ